MTDAWPALILMAISVTALGYGESAAIRRRRKVGLTDEQTRWAATFNRTGGLAAGLLLALLLAQALGWVAALLQAMGTLFLWGSRSLSTGLAQRGWGPVRSAPRRPLRASSVSRSTWVLLICC